MDLRSTGSVLFISCYELGHQPLAVASPMGFLKRAGFDPAVLDIAVERLDESKVERAGLVAISVPMHTALRLGVRVAERVRQVNPAARICFYGLYAALNTDYLLGHVADYCIGGECEEPLVILAEALQAGNASAPLEGVGQRGVPARPHLARLRFPLPVRAGLPSLDRYARLEHEGGSRVAGYVEASRGCLHLCTHCPIPPVYGGRFIVPPDVVLEDVRRQVAAGATHITFGDPDFLNGPGHSLKVVRAIHAEFPRLTFDFTAKVEHILERRDIFPELAESGCVFMISAVESLSDTVLTILEKNHTRADVEEALEIVREAGITYRPTWVPFTPWTTRDDYREILDFVEEHGLIDNIDPVQYGIRLLVPPGSYLESHEAMLPHRGRLDQPSFSYRWAHPDPGMDRLQKEVAALVEHDTLAGEDTAVTFCRVQALAHERSLADVSRSLPRSRIAPRG